MAAAVTITSIDSTQNQYIVSGSIVLTGNYGGASTHGDTLSFAGASNITIPSQSLPTQVEIYEMPAAGTSATGFQYGFALGTTQANGVMQVFGTPATGAATTPLTEYTEAAAYSAGLLAAKLFFTAYFPSL